MNPLQFSRIFDQEFRQNTLNLNPNEIPLFRACQTTFLSLSKQFAIEEYHGSKAQVLFPGQCLMMHPKNNFAEIISAPCNIGFAYGLAANLIGTPIEITSGASQDSRNWLKRVLNGLIQEAVNQDRPPNIARELITMLDGDSEGNETSDSGVKSVVLIKTDRD